jgi:hypothetical protein
MNKMNTLAIVTGLAALMTGWTIAAAQGTVAASDGKWQWVATSDSEQAFVNTQAVKLVGATVEVKVKENFTAPRPAAKEGKTFQSTRTVYRLNCAERKIANAKMEAFSGTDLQGEVVGKASRNDRNLIWMEAPTATVFGEILDYGCRQAAQAPAAAGG